MSKIIGILGLGIFGSSVAKTLSEYENVEIIAVDLDIRNVERISEYTTQAVVGDITDFDFLKSIDIQDCDIVIVATGSNLESSILALMHVKNLGVKQIIAKAKNRAHMEIYQQIGATKVIRPEKEIGERLGRELVRRHIIDVIDIDDDYSLVEFIVPKHWVGHTVVDLNLRDKYSMNVIGVKETLKTKLNVSFGANYKFGEGEIIVAITDSEKFEQADYLNRI